MKKIITLTPPEFPAANTVYRLEPDTTTRDLYLERTDRNIGWITKDEQTMLREAVVGIAGCGGMGGLIAATLLRLGVGEIRIADTEVFDVSNLNRQFAANKETIGRSKALETAKLLRAIADDTTIIVYPEGVTERTAEDFVDGCDVVCDEIEFWAVGSRILLHRAMRAKGGMLLNAPTVGHRVYVTKFTPASMTIEEVLGMEYREARILEKKVQCGRATSGEVRHVMDAMLRFAAPEVPEYAMEVSRYSTVDKVVERLRVETRASIIATNPPMASGFLANHILFELLEKKSAVKRMFATAPPMPGYIMFDAGLLVCKRTEEKWWPDHADRVVRCIETPDERSRVLGYVQKKYGELFGTTPPGSDVYILVVREGAIEGVVALDFPDISGKLPMETMYRLDRAKIGLPVDGRNSAQVGRWIAENNNVSLPLAYASSVYAISLGKKYGWVNHTDAVHRVLTRQGIVFYDMPDATLDMEKVPACDLPFYAGKDCPKPYIMEFAQVVSVLENKRDTFSANGVVFHESIFGKKS